MHVSDLGSGTASSLPAVRWVTYCSKFRTAGQRARSPISRRSAARTISIWCSAAGAAPPFDLTKPLPIPETLLKEWEAYLNQVSVCDSRDPKRLCP